MVPSVVLVVAKAELMVEVAAVFRPPFPFPRWKEGSSTGVRKMIMHTTAARQPPEIMRSLRLCSTAPSKRAKKNALIKKKSAMLTELFTRTGYQNRTRIDSVARDGPPRLVSRTTPC